jgi:hypothetical protein
MLHMPGKVARMQIERSHMRRSLSLALTALFCAFTAAQMTRPPSFIALSQIGVAIRCHRLEPTVEEVDSSTIDIDSASGHLTFLLPAVKTPESDRSVTVMPDEADVTEWTSGHLFRPRNPPRSSADGN